MHGQFVANQGGSSKTRSVYLAGESHAGHYIPSIVAFILKKNRQSNSLVPFIDIKGMLIGNGWIDPIRQYDVSDFAHGHGLITIQQKNTLKSMEKKCVKAIESGTFNSKICFDLLDDVIASSGLSSSTRVNMYDVRQFTKSPNPFPPNHELVEAYMNREDVRAALHTKSSPNKFRECADPPYYALYHQDGKSIVGELAVLLDMNMDTLFFSGKFDLVCNHIGSEKVFDDLQWSGQDEWRKAQPGIWSVNGRTAGYMKTHRSLQYLLVLDAGHMVPLDQPQASLDMLSRFLNRKPFSSGRSKIQLLSSHSYGKSNTAVSKSSAITEKLVRSDTEQKYDPQINSYNVATHPVVLANVSKDYLEKYYVCDTGRFPLSVSECSLGMTFRFVPSRSTWLTKKTFSDYSSVLTSALKLDLKLSIGELPIEVKVSIFQSSSSSLVVDSDSSVSCVTKVVLRGESSVLSEGVAMIMADLGDGSDLSSRIGFFHIDPISLQLMRVDSAVFKVEEHTLSFNSLLKSAKEISDFGWNNFYSILVFAFLFSCLFALFLFEKNKIQGSRKKGQRHN